MKKQISDIELDPSKLSRGDILALIDAGRGLRIECSFCGQGWLNSINFGSLKNIIWCYECDTIFPNLESIENPKKFWDKGISSLKSELDKLGLSETELEISEGYIATYSEDV